MSTGSEHPTPAWPYPWLANLYAQLREQLVADRLGHALLICGPRGTGRHRLARELIAAGVCRQPADVACGTCRDCAQLRSGAHPDVLSIAPPEGRRTIPVETLREVLGALSLSRHYGRRRFVLIDPADALGESGVNALLKTIEEPPAQTVIVMISERPTELRATLRSRCRIHRVGMPATDVVRRWLAEQRVDEGRLDALMLASGGAPLEALSLARDGMDTVAQWLEAVAAVEEGRQLPHEFAANFRDAEQAEALLRLMQHRLHARLMQAETPSPVLAGQAAALAEHRRMLRGNVPAAMVLESALTGMQRALRRAGG